MMIELDEKYVFHIPKCKYEDGELVAVELEAILDDLFCRFKRNGYESAYMSDVKSWYKQRYFDELLITVFTCSCNVSNDDSMTPSDIFGKWFRKNNDVLGQEAFAFEWDNRLFIEKL